MKRCLGWRGGFERERKHNIVPSARYACLSFLVVRGSEDTWMRGLLEGRRRNSTQHRVDRWKNTQYTATRVFCGGRPLWKFLRAGERM